MLLVDNPRKNWHAGLTVSPSALKVQPWSDPPLGSWLGSFIPVLLINSRGGRGATGVIAPRPHGGLYCWDSGPSRSVPWQRPQRYASLFGVGVTAHTTPWLSATSSSISSESSGPSKGGIASSEEVGEAGASQIGGGGSKAVPDVSAGGSIATWEGHSLATEVGNVVFIDVGFPPKGMVGIGGTYWG